MAPSYLIASSSDICLCFIWRPLERKNRFSGWTRTDGAVIESPPKPLTPTHAASSVCVFVGELQ
jgi:hypothetical protein